MNLQEFARKLDKRQRKAKKQNVTIDDEDPPQPEAERYHNSHGRKDFAMEHRQVWFEYYLDQAVDLYGVVAIVASTDAQYLAELEMDYVGFAEILSVGAGDDSGDAV